eukprot:751842-Hanusia_phi.AAC.1
MKIGPRDGSKVQEGVFIDAQRSMSPSAGHKRSHASGNVPFSDSCDKSIQMSNADMEREKWQHDWSEAGKRPRRTAP